MMHCGVHGDDDNVIEVQQPVIPHRCRRPEIGEVDGEPSNAYIIMVKKLDGQDTLDNSERLQGIMSAGRDIHAAVNALDTAVAERLGLPRNDLRCLHLLKYGPVTAGEISARTGLTSGSVTALIDRLEAGGYVRRQRSTADRRSVEIVMSDCRAREFEAIGEEIEQAIRDHFRDKTPAEIDAAGFALAGFSEALSKSAERLSAEMLCTYPKCSDQTER